MKTTSLLSFAFVPRDSVSGSSLGTLASNASFIRKLSFTESCGNDMLELEENTDLSNSLQQTLDTLSLGIDATPMDFCYKSAVGEKTEMNCVVDYAEFSGEYQTMCKESEGKYYPVTLFMECSRDDLDLEMELVNIPNCIAHACDNREVTTALARILRSETTDAPQGLSCHYYHRTINVPQANGIENNGASLKSTGLVTLLASGMGLWLYMF